MSTPPTPRWPRVKRWLCRAGLVLAALLGIYAAFLLLGFIPINGDYALPPADDRVRIFIRSNEIHTDVVLPTVHPGLGIDWRELFPPAHFDGDVEPAPYVAVGWGNRRFFVETPTWADQRGRHPRAAECRSDPAGRAGRRLVRQSAGHGSRQ